MTLTPSDIEALKPYEEQMRTAIRSDYARHVPSSAVVKMVEIVRRTAPDYTTNTRCPRCLLMLYKEVGIIYFKAINKTL